MLDGVRAMACFIVVFGHYFSIQPNNSSTVLFNFTGYFGLQNFGVVLFFCISSFLLSYLFVKEYDARGFNNVTYFFIRRTLRIWPLYFSFLIAINLAVRFKAFQPDVNANATEYLQRFNILLALYLPNWIYATSVATDSVPPNTSFINILWSLGVEEQIYFLFPFVASFLLVKKYRGALSLAIIGCALISRLFYIAICTLKLNGGMYYSTFTYLDVYLIAGLFGGLYARDNSKFQKLTRNSFLSVMVVVLLFYFMHLFSENAVAPYRAISAIIYPVLALLTSFCILWVLHFERSFFSKLLSLNPVRAYGVLSYSIYVWHVLAFLFLNTLCSHLGLMAPAALEQRPSLAFIYFLLYLSFTFSVACASYGLIERPFLRIKERYSVSGSANFFSWQKYFFVSLSLSVFLGLLLK